MVEQNEGFLKKEERKLRDLLWATHPCDSKYCDDGEIQCGRFLPVIDFLRDKPEDIEAKIPLHNAQLAQALEHRLDRPELRILETNPYHDAPDSACEGIYEAGKEAQLEADRELLVLIPDIKGWMSPDECQECQAQTECKIELAVKAERERIMREIEKCETPTVRDLNLIQITMCREDWQALKGEPTIKPLQVLVNGEWREASKELKATADSIEQSLKEGLK